MDQELDLPIEQVQGPVTVLGMTFRNDDERRAHFRKELKGLLPKLRKIDGFPLGEDEEILSLSDPPYYTACPNPWTGAFVSQWEEEKSSIKGRRTDFTVTTPYASDVSEGKNNPIYNAHSYHTKVPHPAIMRYILHYTQPGDIVLDGFAGTGMTGVAAQLCGNPDRETRERIEREWTERFGTLPAWGPRRAVIGDLSPVASFIAYNYNTPVDAGEFEREARKVLLDVEKECGWMYNTAPEGVNPAIVADLSRLIEEARSAEECRQVLSGYSGDLATINYTVWSDVFLCPACGKEIIFWEEAVDKERGEVKKEFPCPHCSAKNGKRQLDRAFITVYDQALKETIRQAKTVPVLINYTSGRRRGEKRPDKLDLAIIVKVGELPVPYWYPMDRMPVGDECRRNDPMGITHVHHFYTKRNLWIISLLTSVIDNIANIRVRKKVYLVLQSINPVLISKLVRYNLGHRGNGPLNGTLYISSLISETSIFKVIPTKVQNMSNININNKNMYYCSFINSATDFDSLISNSIDYIFTDPPFGANIMYSELNFLWESWLKIKTNPGPEAIQNQSQNKGFTEYIDLMERCFAEYYRVLKPGRWMTVEFSNTSAAVWNGIQTALQRAGFVIANVAALDKQQGSFKAVTTPTAVKQDLVISCYKPPEGFSAGFSELSGGAAAEEFLREHLSRLPINVGQGGKRIAVIERSQKVLYDRLISYSIMNNRAIPMDAREFQELLSSRYVEREGMYFLPEQAAQYDALKVSMPSLETLPLTVTTEAEGIVWLREMLKKKPRKPQDLYTQWREVSSSTRKGDILPDLRELLEDNFLRQPDGSYRIPDPSREEEMAQRRKRALIKEYGVYREQLLKPGAKRLKEVRVEVLRVGFRDSWERKEFDDIVRIGERIPEDVLYEDEQLLMYYDIAKNRI